MEIDERQVRADWLMQLNEDKSNPTEVSYRISRINQRLEANPAPIIYSMSVLADLPPEVTLVRPENRVLRVAPTAVVELEVRASDPDYGLSKLKLQVRKNSKVVGETTLIDDAGLPGRQVRTTKLDLRRLQAQVGDRVQLLAAAQDNRHDPVSKQWSPGVALSEPLLLEVVGPDKNPMYHLRNRSPQPTRKAAHRIRKLGRLKSNRPAKPPSQGIPLNVTAVAKSQAAKRVIRTVSSRRADSKQTRPPQPAGKVPRRANKLVQLPPTEARSRVTIRRQPVRREIPLRKTARSPRSLKLAKRRLEHNKAEILPAATDRGQAPAMAPADPPIHPLHRQVILRAAQAARNQPVLGPDRR